MLQKQLIEKTKTIRELNQQLQTNTMFGMSPPTQPPLPSNNSDMQNVITMLQKQLVEKTNTIRELNQQLQTSANAQSTSSPGNNSEIITMLQKQLVEKTKTIRELNQQLQTSNTASPQSQTTASASSTNNQDMQSMITMLQKQLVEKTKMIRELMENKNKNTEPNYSQNMIDMLQKQLIEKTKTIQQLQQQLVDKPSPPQISTNDTQNMITLLQKQLIEKNKQMREYNIEKCNLEESMMVLKKQLEEKNKQLDNLMKQNNQPSFTRIPIEIPNDDNENINKNKTSKNPKYSDFILKYGGCQIVPYRFYSNDSELEEYEKFFNIHNSAFVPLSSAISY